MSETRTNAQFTQDEAFTYLEAVKLVGAVKAFEFIQVSGGTVYGKQRSNPHFSIAVTLAAAIKEIKEASHHEALTDTGDIKEIIKLLEQKIDYCMTFFKEPPKKAQATMSDDDIREMLRKKMEQRKQGG